MRSIQSGCRITQLPIAALLASIGTAAAWAAPVAEAPALDTPALVVPGYGPGVAGHVIEGPNTPVCRPDIPCKKPFANASVLILDRRRATR